MMGASSLKVICAENCGNSPKKQLLKDFTIALAEKNTDFCIDWVRDDLTWEIIGEKQFQGKEEYEKALEEMKDRNVEELEIHHIITHGNTASANGTLHFSNGETIAFCDVYEFAGFGKDAKIKRITSYIISV